MKNIKGFYCFYFGNEDYEVLRMVGLIRLYLRSSIVRLGLECRCLELVGVFFIFLWEFFVVLRVNVFWF